MKTSNLIYTVLLCTAVSCGPLGKYKPVTNVDDSMYGRGVALTDTSSNMARLGWKEVFTDPALQCLIDSALTGNPDLQMAGERVHQAEAMLLGAKMAYLPSVAATPNISGTVMQGAAPSFSYNLVGMADWQIDIFGKLATKVRSSKASLAQSEDYSQAVRVSVISQVANIYYLLMMLDEQLGTSKEMEAVWKKSVETINLIKREGFADEVAVKQYEATYENMKVTSLELEKQIIQAENAMSMLLGKPGQTIVRGTFATQTAPAGLNAGIPVQMLTYRPDVRSAQRACEVAFYQTKSAWLNFFPTLSISGNPAGLTNAFGATVPMTAIANLSANLVAPILSAGVNKANLKYAQSAQREAGMAFDKAMLTACREVNDAMIDYNTCSAKMVHYETQVENLQKARNDTEYLMQNSEGKTYLDVLTAHNALINAKFEMIANKAQRMQAMIAFYTALGGGSEY